MYRCVSRVAHSIMRYGQWRCGVGEFLGFRSEWFDRQERCAARLLTVIQPRLCPSASERDNAAGSTNSERGKGSREKDGEQEKKKVGKSNEEIESGKSIVHPISSHLISSVDQEAYGEGKRRSSDQWNSEVLSVVGGK